MQIIALFVSAVSFTIVLLMYWIFVPLAIDLAVVLTELIQVYADIAKGTL